MAKDDQDDSSAEERKPTSRFSGPGLVIPLFFLVIVVGYLFVLSTSPKRITYKFFLDQLREKNVAEVELFTRYAVGKFKRPPVAPADAKAGEAASRPDASPPSAEKTKTGKTADPRTKDLAFMVTLP